MQHHEPSSLATGGVGFELDGRDALMRVLAGPLAASRPLIRQEGPCVKMSAHAWYTSDDHFRPRPGFSRPPAAAQLARCADERHSKRLERCSAAVTTSLRERHNKRMGSSPMEWRSLAIKTKHTSDSFVMQWYISSQTSAQPGSWSKQSNTWSSISSLQVHFFVPFCVPSLHLHSRHASVLFPSPRSYFFP